jgi:hypothetical protein
MRFTENNLQLPDYRMTIAWLQRKIPDVLRTPGTYYNKVDLVPT